MRTDLEADVLILLYDVARHMRTHADQMARDHGLTRAQWIILVRLARQPDLSQNELAALAEVAPITVARLVDRLEALGLVTRRTDPDDRRIWRLRLTPAAAPVLRDVTRCRKHDQGHPPRRLARHARRSAQDEGEHRQHARLRRRILSVSSGSLSHHFDLALGWAGLAAGAGFSVALDAPSQSQASARRDRTLETLPRLNKASYGAP